MHWVGCSSCPSSSQEVTSSLVSIKISKPPKFSKKTPIQDFLLSGLFTLDFKGSLLSGLLQAQCVLVSTLRAAGAPGNPRRSSSLGSPSGHWTPAGCRGSPGSGATLLCYPKTQLSRSRAITTWLWADKAVPEPGSLSPRAGGSHASPGPASGLCRPPTAAP